MIRIFKILLLTLVLIASVLQADAGDKKIRLLGNMKEGMAQRISPRELEHELSFVSFYVYNPWEKKSDHYEGVLLDTFAKHFGGKDLNALRLIAIDDYEVRFEKDYFQRERILLVAKVNGEYISIKEKGPMRIIFVDYDKRKKEYELNLPQWMWMITKIEFE